MLFRSGLYLLLAVLIPLLFLIVQVQLGNVTDMDIHLREQRQGSLFATALGSAISWIAMTVEAPTRPYALWSASRSCSGSPSI